MIRRSLVCLVLRASYLFIHKFSSSPLDQFGDDESMPGIFESMVWEKIIPSIEGQQEQFIDALGLNEIDSISSTAMSLQAFSGNLFIDDEDASDSQ